MTPAGTCPPVGPDMSTNSTNLDPQVVGAEIERLLEETGAHGAPGERARSQELVRLLMSLYGAGLSRILDVIRTEHGGPQAVLERFANDGLIASLLVLHELHPHPVDVRVRRALDTLQPHLPPKMSLSVVEITHDAVRLRVASGPAGESGAANLRASVERAVQEAAPEIVAIHIDGLDDGALIQIARGATAAGRTKIR